MSDPDEAPEARKRNRRRRRSLRVPVDEVPRPTQPPERAELASEEVSLEDGGATVEIPAYTEAGRAALNELAADAHSIDAFVGVPREDDSDEPLDEAPTVVREAPSGRDDTDTAGEADDRPAPRPVGAGPSVEVDLDAELDDEHEASDFDAGPTAVEDLPDEGDAPQDARDEPEAAAADRRDDESEERDEPAERVADEDGERTDGHADEDASPAVSAIAPSLGVIVQRVVSVTSSSTVPPPPEEDDEDDVVSSFDTVPGGAFAVEVDDVEEHEPGLDFRANVGGEGADFEELDVDLEDSEEAAEPTDSAGDPEAAELSEQEAEALLEEESEAEGEKRRSKPPPPPSNQKAATPSSAKANAPPPPPAAEAEAKPAATKQQPSPRKRPRKKWWEVLFNDDYLRTVPIPHPRTIHHQCDFIEQRFGLAKGATILDVGCGLGLHAVELTRRGYLVVGLDLSLPMLSRAADEAQEHGFKINFLHADMRQMNFDGAFDAVLCWGTTFGYFDDETNKQVIERLYRALKPRGLLLLDVVNRDYVIAGQPNLVWFEGDGCVVMEETQMNYITSRLEVKRNVILDDGRQRDTLYTLRLYSLHELGQLLHLQGFRVVEVSGREAHPGVFFGSDSPKLLITAERRPQGPPSPPGRSNGGTPSQPPSEPEEDIEPEPPAAAAPESRGEPSDDVNAALAATLESSEELDLGEELDPDELETEDLDEEPRSKKSDAGADESE